MEIESGKPSGLKYILESKAKGFQHIIKVLYIVQPKALAAANVVNAPPELLRDPILTYVCQEDPRLDGSHPFQKILRRLMENDRFPGCRLLGGHNSCLTQTHPMLEPGLNDRSLGGDFRDCVIVKCRSLDGISATPPVDRGQTAAGLCHCSDIDQFDRIRIWLCLDRPDDIHSRSKVDLKTALRQFIGFGRNERPHMQHIIRACHTAQDIVVAAEVPPDNLQRSVMFIAGHKCFVLSGRPDQNAKVEAVGPG